MHSSGRLRRCFDGFYFAISALTAALLLSAVPALAAEPGQSGHSEVVLLGQLVVLLAAGRLLGEAMQRLGQPAVMGQLLAGVVLGPSLLGALWPAAEHAIFPHAAEQNAMLDGIAQLGVLLLLLLTGMETDVKLVRKVGRSSFAIAVTGLSVPFACGFLLGQLLPADVLPKPELRLVTSLFLGTALSISSVKIVAMVVREMDFMRRNVGQIIIAAAIIEDTIGWIIIALTFGIALHGKLDALSFGKSVLGTAIFLAASFTLGRRVVARLIRWANDTLVSEVPVITVILIVMGVMALITDAIGVHTVLGAFVAGMLVGQSPILTGEIDRQLRGLITALFMPVFFAVAGLRADLTVLADTRLLLLTLGLIAIASVGKFTGAFLGGRLGGLSLREALAIGCGMNARGSTEVIVATIGLSMGALSQNLFTMIVAMAVLTTLAMPPMLRWALLSIPMGEEEKQRLEREARDAKGFVSQFERLLVTVDDSINARFAAHVAGLIAGSRQILTTVLQIDKHEKTENGPALPPEAVVKASARAAQAAIPHADDEPPAEIEVTAREPDDPDEPAAAAVESEMRKGYDLVMFGVEPASGKAGTISPRLSEAASTSEGPLAIVDARGVHRDHPTAPGFSILLPIRGTASSRRGAEVAIELARASQSPIEALYVADKPRRSWTDPVSFAMGLEEEAALKDVVELAELQGVHVKTSINRSGDPGAAILRRAKRSHHDLIVLGVSRRPGDRLSFGQVAAEIINEAPCSVVLVSS
jgi:K+:H+ antiporter